MAISDKITSITNHLIDDYKALENLGADLTNVDKNIENIKSVAEQIYDNLPKTEYQEGTEITLSNTLKGKLDFDDGKVGFGQASQETTQGYNLLPLNPTTLRSSNNQGTWSNDYTFTLNAVTFTIDYDTGKVKVSGTASSNTDFKIPITLVQGNTYRLSGCPSGGGSSNYRSYLFDIQSFTQAVYDNGSGAVLQSASYTNYEYRIRIANGYTANNIVFEPMVIDGSTAKTFEKYTGGQASPNPSYPQTINSVTGNQDVVVKDGNNNTIATYQLSLGDIELNAIGNYKDELIYDVENDKVYKKAYIGIKNNIIGTDLSLYQQNVQNGVYQYRTSNNYLNNVKLTPDPFNIEDIAYSNYFLKKAGINNLDNYYFTITGNGALAFNSPIANQTNFRNWVDSANIIVYYQLATPTLTEITDTTLINQVKALYNAHSLNGTTIITSNGNLPMIIKVRGLKGGE